MHLETFLNRFLCERNTMQRESIVSSNVRSVSYDPTTNTLEIEFHNGSVYQYYSVPAETHRSLISAVSKGTYHNDYIKDHYRYRKVG